MKYIPTMLRCIRGLPWADTVYASATCNEFCACPNPKFHNEVYRRNLLTRTVSNLPPIYQTMRIEQQRRLCQFLCAKSNSTLDLTYFHQSIVLSVVGLISDKFLLEVNFIIKRIHEVGSLQELLYYSDFYSTNEVIKTFNNKMLVLRIVS